jgi:hypothetical protein
LALVVERIPAAEKDMQNELMHACSSPREGTVALSDTCMEAFAQMVAASILTGDEVDLAVLYLAAGFTATDRLQFVAQALWEDEDIQARVAVLIRSGASTPGGGAAFVMT